MLLQQHDRGRRQLHLDPRSATCSYGGNTGKKMLSSPSNPQSNTYPSSGQTGKKMLTSQPLERGMLLRRQGRRNLPPNPRSNTCSLGGYMELMLSCQANLFQTYRLALAVQGYAHTSQRCSYKTNRQLMAGHGPELRPPILPDLCKPQISNHVTAVQGRPGA